MSIIFVDDNCDLTDKDIKKVGLEYLKLIGKTSAEKYEIFYNAFKEALNLEEDVIYFHPGAMFVDFINIAIKANEQLFNEIKKKVMFIDSGNMSIGYGVSAYMIGIKNKNNANIEEITKYNNINCFKMIICMKWSENLQKFKGLSTMQIANSTLNTPIFEVYKNKIKNVAYVNGINSANIKFLELLKNMGENILDYKVAICGTNKNIVNKFIEKMDINIAKDILIGEFNSEHYKLFENGTICIAFHSTKVKS